MPPSADYGRVFTTASSPALSVVVASVNGWDLLEPTLRSIDSLPERPEMQVIVVDRTGGSTREKLRAHQPRVELVEVSEPLSIPRLRYLGVCRASAPIVAIVEDHGEVNPGWAQAILQAHQGPWGAVGGPVENGRSGFVNWAAFLCEYTPYMGPLSEGPSNDLPGNNVAYKRDHLLKHARVLESGKWESWINDRLRADGVPTGTTNQMVVRHIKPFRLGEFLVQRFHFSRSFAAMRRSEQSPAQRLVYAFGCVALPPVLLLRIARAVLGKKRHRSAFIASIPLLLLMLTAGAVGEMVGYFSGPGTSLEHVE
jgi:hypothetical protein